MTASMYYSEYHNTFLIVDIYNINDYFFIEYTNGSYFSKKEQLLNDLLTGQYEIIGYL